jgi:nucleoside-diphosphate kinase
MIKPDAMEHGNAGRVLDRIIQAGFTVKALKMTRLAAPQAEHFYEVHRERPFFKNLVDFMSSGPIVAAVLEKENAVENFRQLIGATNPEEADQGSIRQEFGTSIEANAVHGSDSDENAQQEAYFFFSRMEWVG